MTHWEHSTASLDFADHNRQNSAQNGVLQRGRHAADTFANVTQRTRRSERNKERIIELIQMEFLTEHEQDSLVWVSDIIDLIRRKA